MISWIHKKVIVMMKKRGPVYVLFAYKIFSLPVLTRPATQTFWQVPDPSRPEVKNPYPSDPAQNPREFAMQKGISRCVNFPKKHINAV